MILVDTSIFIDHFRSTEKDLVTLLQAGEVLMHPWVIGELSLGNLPSRPDTLALFWSLPRANVTDLMETMQLIEDHRLFGLGIGLVDAQLLSCASGRMTSGFGLVIAGFYPRQRLLELHYLRHDVGGVFLRCSSVGFS